MRSKQLRLLAAAGFALCMAAPLRAQTPPTQTPPPAGPITVLTILDVVPNYAMPQNVENSSALLKKLAADTQGAPGLISFKVEVDASRSNHFIILGEWKDMQSFATYSGSDTTKAFRTAFAPRQGGPFDERIYAEMK
jgi:quinol monooxygenase YgiN